MYYYYGIRKFMHSFNNKLLLHNCSYYLKSVLILLLRLLLFIILLSNIIIIYLIPSTDFNLDGEIPGDFGGLALISTAQTSTVDRLPRKSAQIVI